MNKLVPYILLFFLFYSGLVYSQNKILKGKVLFQNSGKKPAVNFFVNGEPGDGSNLATTDETGFFAMEFSNRNQGNKVNVKVEKKGELIEIVNEDIFRNLKIPSNPNELTEIIICKKGERDIAALKYYKILKFSSELELSKLNKQLNFFMNQAKKNYDTIQAMFKKLDVLKQQNDSLNVYKEALAIASINKDNANSRVLKYINLLDEGKSIQEARESLNIREAALELKQSSLQYKNAIEEIETRYFSSENIFDYKDALSCIDTLIKYSENLNIDRQKIATYYVNAGDLLDLLGNFSSALNFHKKAVAIFEDFSEFGIDLIACYNSLGLTYYYLGRFDTALIYQKKGITIADKISDKQNPELAHLYASTAITYRSVGEYDEAIALCKKSMAIYEQDTGKYESYLPRVYFITGSIYFTLEDYSLSLNYVQKALIIEEKLNYKSDPGLVNAYSGIGLIYNYLGDYTKALEYHLKGINIGKDLLNEKHPDLASLYSNTGMTYLNLKEVDKALEFEKKAIAIYKETYDTLNTNLASPYYNIAEVYLEKNDYANALEYFKKSVSIFEVISKKPLPDLGKGYLNIALTYTYLKNIEEGILYADKALAVFKSLLPKFKTDYDEAINCLSILSYGKAIQLFSAKNYQEAISYFENAKNPNVVINAKDYLGLCYANLKNYSKAILYFHEVLLLDTTNSIDVKIYSNIGNVYAKNAQLKEAKEAFEKFDNAHIDDGVANKNWALYYALMKEKEKSIGYLQKAIENGYSNWEKITTDESFEILHNDERYKAIIEKIKPK